MRVLELLELLQDRGRVGGRELAERLGVDPRTVRRYAVKLQELGIPVEAERGPYGGYRLSPGYKLPPLMFTDDEATAVVVGLIAARHFGVAPAGVDSALGKISRVLPDALRERARALRDSLGFSAASPAGRQPASGTVLVLAGAVQRHRRVRVRYESYRGERTVRDIDPYGLVFHAGRWYLAAHDGRRGDVGTFRVDRIGSVEERPEPAPVPEGFDAVEHVTRSLARVPWTHEVEVVLDTTMPEARAAVPRWIGELEETGDGVLLRMHAERLDGAARMLAGLGWSFKVVKPPELQAEISKLAASLLACLRTPVR